MIALDELLIKIGVDGSQAQQISGYIDLLQNGADNIGANAESINNKLDSLLNDVSQSLDGASEAANQASKDLGTAGNSADKAESKFSKLKVAMIALVGGAMLFGGRIASAFNSAISNAEELFKSKNALYSISKDEIAQVDKYKQSLDKTSLSINSIKTKIAINLIPSVTAVSEKFNGWLSSNKDLITNGISKVILWIGRGIQIIGNFIKFIDKIVRSTIGWKNAFIALGIAWAVLNRQFLFSPIGMLVVAFGALLLLVDDLMTYMQGGKSLFGSYWDPLIAGGKKVVEFFQNGEKIWMPILIGLVSYFTLLSGGGIFASIVKNIKSIGTAFKALRAVMMSNPIIAILTAIAVVAYLIYDNWEWLKAKFKQIWTSMSGFVSDAWKNIVDSVSSAIKEVLMYFGMSEAGATQLVSDIGNAFLMIFDLICYPFKLAYDFINELFNIWGDDNTSFIGKLGSSFLAVTDLITAPFKSAMVWIQDKFMGFIDGVKSSVNSVLSFIGLGSDDSSSIPAEQKDFSRYFEANITSPDVPSPNNSDNRTTNNNQENKTTINVYANDTGSGASKAAGLYEKSVENANNNLKHRMPI